MNIIQADSEASLLQLGTLDYSLTVTEVAVPPFEGPRIETTRKVSPFQKRYSLPSDGYVSHLNSSESALFLCIEDGRLLGFVALSRIWNDLVQIDDIAVDTSVRGRGIGSALIAKAIAYASTPALIGIKAETQSINVPACRFYYKNGFALSGLDRHHYGLNVQEIALFWYLLPTNPSPRG